jgi:20S proteasome subunit beta 1
VSFPGGVVLGCDSRVSTGAYVSNRASDKLHPLADAVWMLRSGSAADCQAIGDAG